MSTVIRPVRVLLAGAAGAIGRRLAPADARIRRAGTQRAAVRTASALRRTAPTLAALLAMLAAASLAGGQSPSPAAAVPATTTLHFGLRFSPFFMLDLGRKGASAGDEIVSHDRLLNAQGATVGHDATVCTVTDPRRPEANCVVSFQLPGGTVTAQFLNTPPPRKLAAITGGTGRFRGAGGEVRIVESSTSRGGSATFTVVNGPAA